MVWRAFGPRLLSTSTLAISFGHRLGFRRLSKELEVTRQTQTFANLGQQRESLQLLPFHLSLSFVSPATAGTCKKISETVCCNRSLPEHLQILMLGMQQVLLPSLGLRIRSVHGLRESKTARVRSLKIYMCRTPGPHAPIRLPCLLAFFAQPAQHITKLPIASSCTLRITCQLPPPVQRTFVCAAC